MLLIGSRHVYVSTAGWARHPELLVAAALGLLAVAVIPLASQSTVVMPGLVPIATAVILAADCVGTALLIRAGAGRHGRPRQRWLAAGFAFSGLMAVVFLGTYPNLLAAHGVLGGQAEAFAWARPAWEGGTLLCLLGVLGLPDRVFLAAGGVVSRRDRSDGAFPWVLMPSAGLALLCLAGAELAARMGPPPLRGTSHAGLWQVVAGSLLGLGLLLAIPALRRFGRATQLERGLTAAALVSAASLLVTIAATTRYSLGWDVGWIVWALSTVLAALACVREALSNAQDGRSRDDSLRQAVTHALSRLDAGASMGCVADTICKQLTREPEIDCAQILRFDVSGRASLAGSWAEPRHDPLDSGSPGLPQGWAQALRRRADSGAFVERVDAAPGTDGSAQGFLDRLHGAGIEALAHVPIVMGGRTDWVLSIARRGASGGDATEDLTDVLPVLVDVASVAAVLLAPRVRSLRTSEDARRQIEGILRQGAFHPVYQPILTVDAGLVIGHEALTRFDSRLAPDAAFAAAAGVGLGVELELACLASAVRNAASLPGERGWLSLNASPALLLTATDALARLLASADREIVLEVTEHATVDSYPAIRAALARITPPVRVAVDDAGAGFASLRHVVELRPAFVKLDISLVRNLDQDPMRKAMIAGLVAFAQRSGCALIAEGVETPAELEALRALGVPLVQGFLLGPPAALPATAGAGVFPPAGSPNGHRGAG
ncbi:MAG: EAL domain-containing protein [Candidatus Dormibacteria bacterium]